MKSNDDPLSQEDRSYELPTQEIIQVNHRQRYAATEILFRPQGLIESRKSEKDENNPLLVNDYQVLGLHQMAAKSIDKCDSDLKINLYNNIVLAGGSTIMPGFKERFEKEINIIAEHSAKTDINVFADLHRKNAAWIGGSMLASFSTFKDMAITKEEYDNTPDIEKSTAIHKKSVN